MNYKVHFALEDDYAAIFHLECKTFELEREPTIPSTVFSCALVFARTGVFTRSPYCVMLTAMDEDFADLKNHNTTICVTSDLDMMYADEMPVPQPLKDPDEKKYHSQKEERNKIKKSIKAEISGNITYPEEALVYKSSTNFARVVQPQNFRELIGKTMDLK